MAVGDWSAVTLCTDADCRSFESTWLDWTDSPASWRAKAKARIESLLRHAFRAHDLETEEDVLDLIGNPEVLRDAACFKTFELFCRQAGWENKRDDYAKEFKHEIDRAFEMIAFDQDESGAISDSERYRQSRSVRLIR